MKGEEKVDVGFLVPNTSREIQHEEPDTKKKRKEKKKKNITEDKYFNEG